MGAKKTYGQTQEGWLVSAGTKITKGTKSDFNEISKAINKTSAQILRKFIEEFVEANRSLIKTK